MHGAFVINDLYQRLSAHFEMGGHGRDVRESALQHLLHMIRGDERCDGLAWNVTYTGPLTETDGARK